MKKQLATFMISLSWVIWFMAVFAFSPAVELSSDNSSQDSYSHIVQHSKIQYNSSAELLEIPEFKVDWSLHAKLNPDWHVGLHRPSEAYLSPAFFKKSTPLFDIKDTFIHFFYTW